MNPTDCTGYACPPEHSVPVHEVIVNTPHLLAGTGMDASDPSLWITAGLLILGSGILFTYNYLRNKGGKRD